MLYINNISKYNNTRKGISMGKRLKDFFTEAKNPQGPTPYHLKQAEKHHAKVEHHENQAGRIRNQMHGKGYASSVILGDAAKWHEYAANKHRDAQKAYERGDGGTGRVFARTAKSASETADYKSTIV